MVSTSARRIGSGAAAAAAAMLLAACAHKPAPIPKYVPVGSGPHATLVMRGDLKTGETYGVYLFQDPVNCGGLQQVGVGRPGVDPTTVGIGSRFSTVEMFLTKPDRTYCRVRWSFEPANGRKYLVYATSTPTGCSARVLDASNPDRLVPERTLRRRDKGTQLCIPLAQTSTLAELDAGAQAGTEDDLPTPDRTPSRAAPGGAAAAPSNRPAPVTEDDLGGLKGT